MNINLTEATIVKLDLQPDDVIVLRITDPSFKPTAAAVEEMRSRVRRALGEDHQVVVLLYGLDLEIVRPDEVPA